MGEDARLPEGWTKEFSNSQKRDYYYHQASGKSVWRMEDLPAVLKSDKDSARRRANSASSSAAESRDEDGDEGEEEDDDEGEEESGAHAVAGLKKRPRSQSQESAASSRSQSSSGARAKRPRPPARGGKRRVAIIVPFRDLHAAQQRSKHLAQFVPHMERFLSESQGVEHFHVIVVEQSDDGRKFNRGKLLNIGFKYATEAMADHGFDSFIFHDVDLLPQEPLKEWYAKEPTAPVHIARCWSRYNNNPKYFGGIVAFSKRCFEAIDGFPNTYWGWGGEDDELHNRVDKAGLRVCGPPKELPDAIVDLEGMDLKTKLDALRKTDWKCNVKWEARDEYNKFRALRADIPWWGLHGANLEVLAEKQLGQHTTKVTVDVQLNLNSDGSEHWANRKTDFH